LKASFCRFFVSFLTVAIPGQHFCEVACFAVAELCDLLAATEAVGDDEGFRTGGVDCGQQTVVGDGFRDLEFIGFEAEGSGHSAAAGLDLLDGSSGLAKERNFARRAAKDSFVVAVAVKKNLRSGEAAGGETGSICREKVGQQPDLLAEALGVR
jgi:hypothetical protein